MSFGPEDPIAMEDSVNAVDTVSTVGLILRALT